jgi:hypothetical protein
MLINSATLTARLNHLLNELPVIRRLDPKDYRVECWQQRKAELLDAIQSLEDDGRERLSRADSTFW